MCVVFPAAAPTDHVLQSRIATYAIQADPSQARNPTVPSIINSAMLIAANGNFLVSQTHDVSDQQQLWIALAHFLSIAHRHINNHKTNEQLFGHNVQRGREMAMNDCEVVSEGRTNSWLGLLSPI